jgi:hypothetical protein
MSGFVILTIASCLGAVIVVGCFLEDNLRALLTRSN